MSSKKIYLLQLFILIAISSVSFAQNEMRVDSKIKNITIYLNKAQVLRTSEVTLQPGLNHIYIEKLSSTIEPRSVQVSGKGEGTILSVKHSLNYLNKEVLTPKAKALSDSILHTRSKIDVLNDQLNVLKESKALILANSSLKGNQSVLTTTQLNEMVSFYKLKLQELNLEIDKLKQSISKTSNLLVQFKQELQLVSRDLNKATSDIFVEIDSKTTGKSILEIEYVVNNAGWTPLYDLRADSNSENIKCNLKAKVFQNTGEKWENVNLTLSTYAPTSLGSKPELSTWNVGLYDPSYYKKRKTSNSAVYKEAKSIRIESTAYDSASFDADEYIEEERDLDLSSAFVTPVETFISVEYSISKPYTLESNLQEITVDVNSFDMKADFIHYSVPKIKAEVYLIANVANWSQYNVITGLSNVFFDGKYVGESFLDSQEANDTLTVMLGKDPSVIIERDLQKDYTLKTFVGTYKKDSKSYQIIVKNTKNKDITIRIEDQIPVSADSQITVEIFGFKGNMHEVDTGILKWDLKIRAHTNENLKFGYTTKYPKNKVIANQ